MARGMGSPRQAANRRRRTREGPEPACVLSPGDDSPHLSLPNSQPLTAATRGVKTVKIQEAGPPRSPWTRPSAPGCGDTSKAQAKNVPGRGHQNGGSGVAIDWVTGRSYSHPSEVSGDGSMYSQAYGRPGPSVAVRDRGR